MTLEIWAKGVSFRSLIFLKLEVPIRRTFGVCTSLPGRGECCFNEGLLSSRLTIHLFFKVLWLEFIHHSQDCSVLIRVCNGLLDSSEVHISLCLVYRYLLQLHLSIVQPFFYVGKIISFFMYFFMSVRAFVDLF